MADRSMPLRPIGEIAENLDAMRRPVKASERQPGPYPYYGAQGVVDHVSEYLFDGEFVLVAEDGENLRSRKEEIALIARGKFWVNNHAHILRGTKESDTRYLYYAINAADISGYVTGSTIPKLSQGNLNRLYVPCPQIDEQRAVVSILGSLDDKIELNRHMNETLEAMARAIFKDWFVDFGPTRAKMEGRAPYLAPEIWALFPEKLDDEGKPEGWISCDLGTLFELNPAERLPQGTSAPYIDMAALPTQGSWPSASVIRAAGSGARFRNGDTLFARITPCLENGKAAFIACLKDGETAWGSTEFVVIRARPPVPPEMGYLVARDEAFRTHAIQSMTGTSGRQRAQADVLRGFKMTQPPERLLLSFGTILTTIFKKIASNAEECASLAATRDLLLPKLMSGEIRLKDAEKIAEAAA